MSNSVIAAAMFGSMMVLLATGQRLFAVIGFVAAGFAMALWGQGHGVQIPFDALINLMNWYALLSLPLFIYMGYMLSESGIANDLYEMFYVWSGRLKGGLAIGTIILMVFISAMNGLSVAGMTVGTSISLPELLRRGYDKRMVTGVIQAGSSLGIMVPPSVVLILYGMIAHQPIGRLWLAGVLPGLLLAGLFCLYILIRCKWQPHLAPMLSRNEQQQITWKQRLRLLRSGLWPIIIIFSMTGLFFMGVTNLVQSSAVGALAATVATVVKGRMTRQVMREALHKTLNVSCMFMWIVLAAMAFGAVFDGLGAGDALLELFVTNWEMSPWLVLIMMQLSFLVMGTFMDDTAMLLIVAPVYIPMVQQLGFNPIWFGILYTVTCQIAYITPPFGYNLFLMRALAPPQVTLSDIYQSIVPFLLIMIIGLAILMAFPQIALWLPNLYYGAG